MDKLSKTTLSLSEAILTSACIGIPMTTQRLFSSVVLLTAALSIVGCSEARTPAPEASTRAADGAEVTVSDEVMSLLRQNNTMTAAVKLHLKETGLSLEEAKRQVEEVIEREGIVLGGGE